MKIVQKNTNKEDDGDGDVGVDVGISRLSPILDDRFGLIKDFELAKQHYDEPKFWNYAAVLNSSFYKNDGRGFSSKASGISLFSQKLAVLKCLGESIERYCNFLYQKSFSPFVGSFDKIVSKGINPKKFVVIHKEQLKDSAFKVFKISNKSLFSWSECLSLISKKSVLIPSQLIYLSYPHLKDEPTLYPGISTGAAGGFTKDSAIVRGIYEIVRETLL